MQKEKVRIFALARELGWETRDLLTLCRDNGIDVKNQLSTIEPEVRDAIVQLVQRHGSGPGSAMQTQAAAPPPPLGQINSRVRVLGGGRPVPQQAARPKPPVEAPAPPAPPVPAAEAPRPPVAPAAQPPAATRPPAAEAPRAPAEQPAASKAPETPPVPPVKPAVDRPADKPAQPQEAATAPRPPAPPTPPPTQTPRTSPPPVSPRHHHGPVRHLGNQPRGSDPKVRSQGPPRPRPTGPVPPPPLQKKFTKPEDKKPEAKPGSGPVKLMNITPEMLQGAKGPLSIEDIFRTQQQQQAAARPGGTPAPVDVEDDEEGGDKKKKGHRGAGGGAAVPGRDKRHQARNQRQQERKRGMEGGRAVALIDDEPQQRRGLIRHKRPRHTEPRKGKVPIELPITVRSLSEAMGVRMPELMKKLMAQNILVNINSTLDPDLAEALALEHGCELEVKRAADAEELLLADANRPDDPEELQPRAPVVTIMGHVDHGKTSLLDRIRKSNVAATEHGGITQVIRAWRVEHEGKWITFLDTPGHEAFTKMRARGANVTDIAVIVVAADDGVMPQTEEAINHAKAAGVSIVVAINKVDLPNANLRKTEQQLYGMGLIPDNMGGDVPFVQTSAATGKGIDDLLETLSLVAEVKELKANANRPATGSCLEANLTEGEGVFATLLVRQGTLHRGDVVLCGASYGRIRAMYDDQGRHIEEAGPSVPVRITGLDEVPNADDPFVIVPDLATAREIADKRKSRMQEASLTRREPVRLETLGEHKIVELKVILKADFRGSIEAIRKELEKLKHEEVRVRVLHTGIGAITESDVQLALTSPEDTLILGFNCVPDDRARALADERGIQIRQYNIIYNLTDDVRSALEGKLKPREEVIHLGRAVVRQTYKISRVGTIAGCYVTQGTIERSAKVRVIRNGVVIYPPPDRTAGLESLKRFKEDAREVREGFECGLKVAGYDDVKVDDVIEAYRIEQVQRTLS